MPYSSNVLTVTEDIFDGTTAETETNEAQFSTEYSTEKEETTLTNQSENESTVTEFTTEVSDRSEGDTTETQLFTTEEETTGTDYTDETTEDQYSTTVLPPDNPGLCNLKFYLLRTFLHVIVLPVTYFR